jgi:hypothetical protein
MTVENKTVFARIEHSDKPFTMIDNDIIRTKKLSWKAKGLLTYLLSHSEGYQIRVDNLHTFSKDGPTSTISGIKELKDTGHMCFVKKQDPVTKQWLAGYWIISERPKHIESLTIGKPDHRKAQVRERLDQENQVLSKKDQEERISNKKEEVKEKKAFLKKSSFDPEDLPSHLGNNQPIKEAWERYVQSRREKNQKITKIAYTMLVKKMLIHSPEEVVTALDISSERGYTGVFYPDDNKQPTKGSLTTSPKQPQTLSCPEATELHKLVYRFLDSATANEGIPIINESVRQMKEYQNHLKVIGLKSNNEWHPFLQFFGWNKFFKRWIEFLEEKQPSFHLQSVYNLRVGETRWREFILDCSRFGNCDMETGRSTL